MQDYIKRNITKKLLELSEWYQVLFVTGARQCGKSTLIKSIFKDHQYINLEDPAVKSIAKMDPSGFINSFDAPTILDEAQNVPEIFSAIQVKVDKDKINGYFVLSGSQNFLMNKNIRQSLAGRVGVAELPVLSFSEIINNKASTKLDPVKFMLNGQYPALYSSNIPHEIFYKNYIETYIKRDVQDIIAIRNKTSFLNFLKICAHRCGKLINYAQIARSIGITVNTVKSWLDILQQSYIVFLIYPYYKNIEKSLTKTPKLYFYDTGLIAYLLRIDSNQKYFMSEQKGAIFENFIISERYKKHKNLLCDSQINFYRDDSKIEVDLYDATDKDLVFAEIKSSTTYNKKFSNNVALIGSQLNIDTDFQYVIYAGEGAFNDGDVKVLGINEWLSKFC